MIRSFFALTLFVSTLSLAGESRAYLKQFQGPNSDAPGIGTKVCLVTVHDAETIALIKQAMKDQRFEAGPNMVGPDLKYTAHLDGAQVVLMSNTDRSMITNRSKTAQALQDIAFEKCHY